MIPTLYKTFQRWSDKGSVYIISDPHFDDTDCKLMNPAWPPAEWYVNNINKKITKNDTLVCLGDVGNIDWVRKIKAGYKVLVTGNHDHNNSYYQRSVYTEYYDASDYESKGVLIGLLKNAYPYHAFTIQETTWSYRYEVTIDNKLFDEVYNGPLFIADRLLLSHEPVNGLEFCVNIHGHVHSGQYEYIDDHGCYHINLAADVVDWGLFDLGKEIKDGLLSGTHNIHRFTIDGAVDRKNKR